VVYYRLKKITSDNRGSQPCLAVPFLSLAVVTTSVLVIIAFSCSVHIQWTLNSLFAQHLRLYLPLFDRHLSLYNEKVLFHYNTSRILIKYLKYSYFVALVYDIQILKLYGAFSAS
jgi:hypothetical protein